VNGGALDALLHEPGEALPGRPAVQGFGLVPGYLSHRFATVPHTNGPWDSPVWL
jgi:hypothetical protein